MTSSPLPDFDEPRLADAVERLPTEAIDRLPFGAIRLDASGVVRFYSRAEARLSGYGTRKALGLHFFTQMAPCMDNPEFRGRIERALAAGTLDIELNWYGATSATPTVSSGCASSRPRAAAPGSS
jgi:photoactive yellow protein